MQLRSVVILSSTIGALTLGGPVSSFAQTPPAPAAQKPASVKVPDAEMAAAKAIGSSPDAPTMVAGATAFMQKYPKSTLAHQIAVNVSAKVSEITDPAQLLPLAQQFRAAFPGPEEADLVLPLIVDADLKQNKIDDATKEVTNYLGRHPDDLVSLTQMSIVGAEAAKHQNQKYIGDAEKDGLKAISLIEGDQRPANMGDEQWAQYKTKWLAMLYQSVGICSMINGKSDDAKARLTKSAEIGPKDPTTFYLLGSLANKDYEQLKAKYTAIADGPAKDEARSAMLAAMDALIDDYAHAVALSSQDASLKQMHDTILDDLTAFYKFRHKNTDGLQALIDKYKPAGGGL